MMHVDHLLTRYLEGMLTPSDSARVRAHLGRCARCRENLARREYLANDLRLALGQNPIPREKQISQWWQQIAMATAAAPPAPSHISLSGAMLPALLTALILILPISLALAQHGASPYRGSTGISPVADTTLQPHEHENAVLATQELPHLPSEPTISTTVSTPELGIDTTPTPVVAPLAP